MTRYRTKLGLRSHGRPVKVAEFLTTEEKAITESVPAENRAEHLIEVGRFRQSGMGMTWITMGITLLIAPVESVT
jgi:hypothetical protein